jgi:hypothetical protein
MASPEESSSRILAGNPGFFDDLPDLGEFEDAETVINRVLQEKWIDDAVSEASQGTTYSYESLEADHHQWLANTREEIAATVWKLESRLAELRETGEVDLDRALVAKMLKVGTLCTNLFWQLINN